MPPRSIALFGLFGVGNIGNDATLVATLHGLRQRLPNARLSLVSAPPDAVGLNEELPRFEPDTLPISGLLRRFEVLHLQDTGRGILQYVTEPVRLRRTRALARQIDTLLVPGTGIADDFGQGPHDVPRHLLHWCAAAVGEGVAVRFASVGVGPIHHPLSRRRFADALRHADYRSYRDRFSSDFALQIGVPTGQDQVLPDLVFSLPMPASVPQRQASWPPRVVGLGIMNYSGWNAPSDARAGIYADYLRKIVQVADELLQRGCVVRLLTGSRGGDRRTVADIVQAFSARPEVAGRLVARPILSYIDLLGEIAAVDAVIATRFHNVLLSLMLQRPAISIGYALKNDELMAEMGFAEYCHSIDTFEPAEVLAQFERLAAEPEPPIATARHRTAEYRELLEQQFDQLIARPGG